VALRFAGVALRLSSLRELNSLKPRH